MTQPTQLIPVFGQIPDSDIQRWVDELSRSMSGVRFASLDDLTEAEKLKVRFAIVANPTTEQLQTLPALTWVQSVWAGVEKLVKTFAATDIKLTRLIDPELAATMAESALTWCLYLNRDMHLYEQHQRAKHWRPLPYRNTKDCTVGILGLGELGRACAERLQQNHFNICSWSRTEKAVSGFDHYAGLDQLTEVLKRSDILLNLLPLTPETKGLLDKTIWPQCRDGVCLINFGRGPTVVEDDLLDALDQGKPEFAVLDVFEQEPLPESHPFWERSDIRILPHISAPTSVASAAQIVTANLNRVLAGNELPETVDLKRGY